MEDHEERHIYLHRCLDELVADWITHTGKLPSQHTIMDLIKWSYQQTVEPNHER